MCSRGWRGSRGQQGSRGRQGSRGQQGSRGRQDRRGHCRALAGGLRTGPGGGREGGWCQEPHTVLDELELAGQLRDLVVHLPDGLAQLAALTWEPCRGRAGALQRLDEDSGSEERRGPLPRNTHFTQQTCPTGLRGRNIRLPLRPKGRRSRERPRQEQREGRRVYFKPRQL